MNAHKKVKQETHMRLMRDCGGGGKKFDVPPTDFIPYSLIVNGGCARCDERFSDESNLIEHIKIAHGGEIKKHIQKKPWKMFLEIKNTMNGGTEVLQ